MLGVLCTFGFTGTTSLAISTPTAESLVPDLDSHRDRIDARAVKLCFQHSGVPQGASRYRRITVLGE